MTHLNDRVYRKKFVMPSGVAHPLIIACIATCVNLSSTSYATSFDKARLDDRFQSKTTDHGVIFTRISDGKILYERNSDQLLSPASVTKVITSAAALSYFGPSFAFKTPLYHTGHVIKGHLTGDLFIKGNGDPFLVSEVLWQTAMDLRHLGIKAIDGDIVIDSSLFDSEDRDESRAPGASRSTHAYDAPVSAFAVNFNTVAVAIAPTAKGFPAILSLTPFPLRSVKLSGRVMTTAGSADSASASRTTLKGGQLALNVNGTIGEEAPIKKVYRSVASPLIAGGDYFRSFLEDAGIKIKGQTRNAIIPHSANVMYDIQGYDMRRITAGLNTFSNNFIADMLTKRLGAAFPPRGESDVPGSGTLTNGVAVLTKFLREDVGIKSAFTLLNGSGLSIENRLSARQIVTVLQWMEHQGELFPDFLGSLPANGWDGTLKKRIKKAGALAGMIRAKSGTLTEPITVAGMAGFFRHPSEGWVSFVMIANGREGKGQPGLLDLRNLQDETLKSLFEDTK